MAETHEIPVAGLSDAEWQRLIRMAEKNGITPEEQAAQALAESMKRKFSQRQPGQLINLKGPQKPPTK